MTSTPLVPRSTVTAIAAGAISIRAASKKIGMARSTLIRNLARMIAAGDAPDSLLDSVSIMRAYEQIDFNKVVTKSEASTNRKLAEARARARKAEKQLEDYQYMDELKVEFTQSIPNPPSWTFKKDGLDHILDPMATERTPILCLGDLHFGEVVDPRTAGGFKYNSEIAEARIKNVVQDAISICRDQMSGYHYPGIVLPLIGDMTSGALHPELAATDEYSQMRAKSRCVDILISVIENLADEFGNVVIPTAIGNHGRLFDAKGWTKGYAERNSDYWIYDDLKRYFRNDKRISIANPLAGETLFPIYGREFLVTHGDRIGAGGGTGGVVGAVAPISRGIAKVKAAMASLGTPVYHVILGHYHQHILLKDATVNGCPKGPDEYAGSLLRAVADDPSQTLMMVSPRDGITLRMPLYMRDEHCPNRDTYDGSKWAELCEEVA